MESFDELNLTKALRNALETHGFQKPTPIQTAAFPLVRSGKNVVGIAQTGTGKTLAYLLPILQDMKYSEQRDPRVLILVPTRELVTQVVEQIEKLAEFMTVHVLGVFGGSNIRVQRHMVEHTAANILVATPGRLYDLVLSKSIRLNLVKMLVIDEVDVMLDLGFRFQLTNIFDLLPEKRQNIMFSATMTENIDELIQTDFIAPERISIAVSGTRLDNIEQLCYPVQNYYTKENLLTHLLRDKSRFSKTLVFVSSKRIADRLHETLDERLGSDIGLIHANKSQNYRKRSIEDFENGRIRVLVTTDVMARGLDLEKISHVINFDTPIFPENYMHRIGRTGRAEEAGNSILFFTEKEAPHKEAIETLMDYKIPVVEFPEEVEIDNNLAPEERKHDPTLSMRVPVVEGKGAAFHEKSKKNQKVNEGGGKRKKELKKKYNKPKTRGDKRQNMAKKKKKR